MVKKTIEEKRERAKVLIAKRRELDPIQNALHSVNSQRRAKGKKEIRRVDYEQYLEFCIKAKFIKNLTQRRPNNGKFSLEAFLRLKQQNLIVI